MSGRTLYIEEHENDGAPCRCGSCDWRGTFAELNEVTDGALTAGDASPAGRCPDEDCDSFAYLNRPEDRAQDALRALIQLGVRPKGLDFASDRLLASREGKPLAELEAAVSEAWGRKVTIAIVVAPGA